MSKISFHGSLETGDQERVTSVLKAWAGGPLQVKVGRIGVEIVFEQPALYLFCHEASTGHDTSPFYLLEGSVLGPLDEAEARLRHLCKLCQDSAVAASIDYVQVDEEGEWLSEELTLVTDL